MSKDNEKHHIIPYKTFVFILLALLALTFISILVTNIHLGPLTVITALVLSAVKSTLVLAYFMHLKFDVKIFGILVFGVIMVIGVLIFITFLDYLFR